MQIIIPLEFGFKDSSLYGGLTLKIELEISFLWIISFIINYYVILHYKKLHDIENNLIYSFLRWAKLMMKLTHIRNIASQHSMALISTQAMPTINQLVTQLLWEAA